MKPFLKWVGGKRQLLPEIRKYIPKEYSCYIEPFVGAGAVFMDLKPQTLVINDKNEELIICYQVIKNNVNELIEELKSYENNKEFFLRIRSLDREDSYKNLSKVKKAARIIYLNKTCFNGLYRVNQKGYFNVPFGKYANPTILDKDNLKEISEYLNSVDVKIFNKDFSNILKEVKSGDFVYLDPPYDPISKTANFTGYSKDKFDKDDQKKIKELLDSLNKKGAKWLLSNSCTDFIKELYKDYTIIEVNASRNVNSDASKRGKIKEVLIKNY